jgi:predicted HicB family RNase H-like nuclease
MLEYKGYFGTIEPVPEEGRFRGTVHGAKATIRFAGTTYKSVEGTFRKGIDAYLKECEARGISPDREYSGNLMIRMAPALHRKACIRAEAEGLSMAAWITRLIENA